MGKAFINGGYKMKEITSVEQFNEIINSDEKVVVKFYTNWCPDCVRLNMFIGEIQENIVI